jgi:DNA-binding beta-propeller fold protein YncE
MTSVTANCTLAWTRRVVVGCCLAAAHCMVMAGAIAPAALSADVRSPPLVLEATIPLDGVAGRIDHMAVDLGRNRLLVAELGNNTVDVIDLATRRSDYRIASLQEPQGVAVAAAADVVVVTNGGNGSVAFFHADNFAPVGRVDLGNDADNTRVDASTGRVIVGYGQGALAIIDPSTRSKIGDVRLAAHPEGFQLTPDGSRAFVNVPDAKEIAVVDIAAGRQVSSWSVPNLRSNFPMAINPDGSMLAVVFRSPARLVLLKAETGVVLSNLETCGDADDVFFDAARNRIYVSCGQGAVDVFDLSRTEPVRLARIHTSSGARTALFVPGLDRLFVAARSRWSGGGAKLLVYRPEP